MRRRIILATVAVAVAGIVVFGVPLAIVARSVVRADELRRLDREADAVAFAIDDDIEAGRPVDPTTARRVIRPDRYVVVTDPQHRRTIVGAPIEGRTITAVVRTALATTVRIEAPAHHADERTIGAIAVVVGLALAGLAVAVALAVVVAGRIARPLSALAEVSARLGAGDFSARAEAVGIPEADAVAATLNATAQRIDDLLDAERSFSANASHQLRTPLTALRLHVEELASSDDPTTREDAQIALAEADRLERTIDELLEFARRGRPGPREDLDVSAVLHGRAAAWQRLAAPGGRRVVITSEDGCRALASGPTLDQSLDALVDNAVRHGAGDITISASAHGRYVEIVVADGGTGVTPGDEARIFERHVSLRGGTGVGLALARSLVQADGGRLDLVRTRPPAFRILLPAP
ncbi:MAG: histidine kinase [Actinomycetia bacterium]|nr:histidine kinase [Actinomycetes bacterium]